MANTGAKPIVVSVTGGIFLYSGIKGITLSAVVRDLLTGRNPSKDAPAEHTAAEVTPSASGNIGKQNAAPVAGTATARNNQAMAKPMAALYGWTEKNGEWQALVTLWNNESGWDNTAYNKSSGATGIPQAVPGTKMPLAAQAPTFSARVQIAWGLTYIKGRYGSPSKALAWWNVGSQEYNRTHNHPDWGHWY
jgi:hypothetical protein